MGPHSNCFLGSCRLSYHGFVSCSLCICETAVSSSLEDRVPKSDCFDIISSLPSGCWRSAHAKLFDESSLILSGGHSKKRRPGTCGLTLVSGVPGLFFSLPSRCSKTGGSERGRLCLHVCFVRDAVSQTVRRSSMLADQQQL